MLLQNFAILQQLLPLLRLDGYYIISDLTGVPDMFTPHQAGADAACCRADEPDDRVQELKPWVRRVVTGYVLTVVPLLVAARSC